MHHTPKIRVTVIIVISIIFKNVVSAQALRWKRAGNVNATGVHETDPKMAKNDEVLSPIIIVKPMVNNTNRVRVTFL